MQRQFPSIHFPCSRARWPRPEKGNTTSGHRRWKTSLPPPFPLSLFLYLSLLSSATLRPEIRRRLARLNEVLKFACLIARVTVHSKRLGPFLLTSIEFRRWNFPRSYIEEAARVISHSLAGDRTSSPQVRSKLRLTVVSYHFGILL